MEHLRTEEAFRAQIAKGGMTIAVFKATWCKDCHFIEPFMPEVEQKYAGRVTFVEIDRDELPDLCLDLGIMGIPSFIAYVEGQEVVRFVSKLRKTRDEIEQFIDRALEVAAALPKA
ncbi:thiol-disulfide isomerase [Gordoniibacillus kamchatkensis]|uniref:Thiol-disulfide isomerase n=1 Tax=Gordoniibacillus kamchatkensis TaxID=1590651 RepID=A0ABR5AJM8_9BACL|nr:thioredoxin family protein [Paenibacillus sp. VKM B-2647]KIL41252.1 thiol-disulfide isomerase [Paenibacillus sp. VKM B-2647]